MHAKEVLPNGVRILTENIPYVRSASLGVYFNSGSRGEKAAENGASHYIEHMVFKGTGRRTAEDIAVESDAFGGQLNAYTTKECTCFYGRVLDTQLPSMIDLLGDMLLNSRFDEADVLSERNVIREEIDMYADTPDDLVLERLFTGVFSGNPLARPILGTRRTLENLTGEFLKDYQNKHYLGGETVVALCGSFTEKDVALLRETFSALPAGCLRKARTPQYKALFTVKKKRIEQNHLCLCFPGLNVSDDRRFAGSLLSSLLGGGMSSRLFQSVREQHGLCYSIYTFESTYQDIGVTGIYTALGRDSEAPALRLILQELDRLCQDGVPQEELDRTREQIKAGLLMSLESTGARMSRMAKSEMTLNQVSEPDEIIARYDAVTRDDVLALAGELYVPERMAFSAVGRVGTADEYRDLLNR